jgi:hypothetical protein
MKLTTFFRPTSRAAAGAPAQGEWVNEEPAQVLEARGAFRPLPAEQAVSLLGQAPRQVYRWRGVLPDEVRPEPGWEIKVAGVRYRVLPAAPSVGRTWRLDVEALDR